MSGLEGQVGGTAFPGCGEEILGSPCEPHCRNDRRHPARFLLRACTHRGRAERIRTVVRSAVTHNLAGDIRSAVMDCSFGVLGPMRVLVDGVDVTPRAPKERSLMALLVLEPGQVVSADRLIDELWSGLAVERARRVLWVRVSGLRKLFGTAAGLSLLQYAAPGYRLAVEPEDVDAHRFFSLVGAARLQRERGEVSAAAETLRRALAIWRGEALHDAQGCCALESEAARLTDAWLDAIEEWIDAELACGRHDAIQAEVRRLAAAHPLRERLARHRAVCLYRAGRPAEALAACKELRTHLCEELGLEPGPELDLLERQIAERSAALAAPAVSAVRAHAASPQRALERRPAHRRTDTGNAFDDGSGPRRPMLAPDPQWSVPSLPSRSGRHDLPVELTRFVGRSRELNVLEELLTTYRLVTLTGVGGVGKTRLALAAAAGAAVRYRDGVRLIELATVRADAAVPAAFSRSLGIITQGDRGADELVRDLIRYLAPRRTLLVVDTAEHVVAGVAGLVHELVSSCPDATLLVTSRERLHVSGEAVFAVPPLSLPATNDDRSAVAASDAVSLFCDRLHAGRPDFVMSDSDLAAAAKVCKRVDGLPLAIELAAARVPTLGVGGVSERLDHCFSLLAADRGAGLAERHQTLRATLDWSFDLLSPAERGALCRLAVFPGAFDLDAAISVVEGGEPPLAGAPDAVVLVCRLFDKSLVVVVGTGEPVRYRLLDPIRQYAAERLDAAGETAACRRFHRDVFLARHEAAQWPLMTSQEREQVFVDREDLIAALEWSWHEGDDAAALRLVVIQSMCWMYTGDVQVREWLERVVADPVPLPLAARARALNELALVLSDDVRRDGERIDRLMREATSIASAVGDAGELAACDLAQVEVVLARGRVTEAKSLTEAALGIYERLQLPAGIGWCHYFLAWIAVAEDDPVRGRAHFERALDVARSTPGAEWLMPHALAGLAAVVAWLGQPGHALRLAAEAVSTARPFGVRAVLAMALARAAEVAILANDDVAAATTLGELLQLLLDLGTRRWAADALEMVAVVLERGRRHDTAMAALSSSEVLREAAGERDGGVRAVAEEVRRSASRLRSVAGGDELQAHRWRARSLPPEAVMAEMVVALRALDAP